MGKRIRDYVKYTVSELELYTKTIGSCVNKISTPIHMNFPPYGLINVRETLPRIITQNKIGFYDTQLKGIILDIRNIKVLGNIGALRFDDPSIHLDIRADCYVFQPQIGAIVKGLVKYISDRQIGVIIYRVFSVTIRLGGSIGRRNIELNSEIEFRIKEFDLQNVMPFIEGEFVKNEADVPEQGPNKKVVFSASSSDDDNEDDELQMKKANKSDSKDGKHRKRSKINMEHTENGSSGYNSDGSLTKRIQIKPAPDDSESDNAYSTKHVRNTTISPDMFADLNESLIDESNFIDEPEQKFKRGKLPQTPVKQSKPLEITISDSDSSSSPQKTKRKKSKHLNATQLLVDTKNCSLPNDSLEIEMQRIKSENIKQDSPAESKKRKRNSSISSESIPAKRKRNLFPEVTSPEIVLDSDIEMIITPKQSKKNKSKDISIVKSDESVSEFLDPNVTLDLSNQSRKSKRKNSKSQDNEASTSTRRNLNSSLRKIVTNIKEEKSWT